MKTYPLFKKITWKQAVFTVALAGLFTMVACGSKDQGPPADTGVNIVAVDQVSYGGVNNSTFGMNGSVLNVTVQDNSYTMSFQVTPSTQSNFTNVQSVGSNQYVLQSVCTDTNCRQMAFLVLVRANNGIPQGIPSTVSNNGVNGSGAQYSRAFLFRMNAYGRLERVNMTTGYYSDISQALGVLGVYSAY